MPPPDPSRTADFPPPSGDQHAPREPVTSDDEPGSGTASHGPGNPATPAFPDPAATVRSPIALSPSAGDYAARLSGATSSVSVGRYELGAEIARGGMGAVYRATDTAFGREVAVKVLQERFAPTSAVARRFADEARITGQLQHPNIPAVHDLGTLPDGRPFLAMKLIKGNTFDDLLKARPDPSADRGRYVAAFEQVCQAVAYAHAHNVIHRDLKPGNVMVGAFGEVQLMDWGLAKVLGTLNADTTGPDQTDSGTAILLLRESESAFTQAGSVLGTPAFMPPEQAIGAINKIDARSDVFGLGAVLAVILTGKPPFLGENAESTRQLAARGKVDECFARLDACGAEPELVALAKACLSPERDERPADAGEVARTVAGLRSAAEERANQAELDRARADVRTAEQRKRRKVQLALASAVGFLLTAGAGFAWYSERVHADGKATDARLAGERDTEQRLKTEQARRGVQAARALADDLRRQYKFNAAEAALAQAAELAGGGAPELLAGVEQARGDLAFAVRLDDIRFRKWVWVEEPDGKGEFDTKVAPPEYREAFAAHGFDPASLTPDEVARRVAASGIRAELVAALDDWALYELDAAVRGRLLEIARRADADPWRDRLRDPAIWADAVALGKLAASAGPAATPPAALTVLAELMKRSGLNPVPLLASARLSHPTDFELSFALGRRFMADAKDQATAPFEAARSIRPENPAVWTNLGSILYGKGDDDGAIVAHRKAIALNPKFFLAYYALGSALYRQGNLDGAIAAARQSVALAPEHPFSHHNLGVYLADKGDDDGAIAAYKQAIAVSPGERVRAHYEMGKAMARKGDIDGGIVVIERGIGLAANPYPGYLALGYALTMKGDLDGALAAYRQSATLQPNGGGHYWVGRILEQKGDQPGAITAYRKAITLDPKHAPAHHFLGIAVFKKGDRAGGVSLYRKVATLRPKWAPGFSNLGEMLSETGDAVGAVAAYQKALALDPKYALAHHGLGDALTRKGDVAGAAAAYRQAIALEPEYPAPHYHLGLLLYRQGRTTDALPLLRRGRELAAKQPEGKFYAGVWADPCVRLLAAHDGTTAPPPRAVRP